MKTIQLKTPLRTMLLASSVILLASCAATSTLIEHHNLDISTHLSKTVFLNPVTDSQKTLYVSVKNTSEQTLSIQQPLIYALKANGYRIVTNPNTAHYLLQANILTVGKMSISASQSALGGGYGSALAGAGTGAALGALSGHSSNVLAGGIAGGVIGLATDSLVKDVNYTMITDVKISERTGKALKPIYTRIVSNANQVNLAFNTARPALERGLVKTLAGIF